VPGFLHIPSPYPYRYAGSGVAAANELEQAILREGAETVAMFLAEPVQGVGGVIVPPADYFPRIRAICDQYDVLLAADEVITGFGRTGRMFALEHWGVEPDLLQFAKGITSGYFPFGGVGLSDEIAASLDSDTSPWMHAFTYSAHPVGSAVALRLLDIVDREAFPARAAELGQRLLGGLRSALGDHPNVGEIRGLGLMCAVELVKDRDSKAEFPAGEKVGTRINAEAQRRGLFSRNRADIYMLAPPFVVTTSEIDRGVCASPTSCTRAATCCARRASRRGRPAGPAPELPARRPRRCCGKLRQHLQQRPPRQTDPGRGTGGGKFLDGGGDGGRGAFRRKMKRGTA
jgi:adenosylmethionine-8-amino-7-oxononanoate aminotransferase